MQIAVDKTNLKEVDPFGAHAFNALTDGGLHGLLRDHGGLEDTPFGGSKYRLGRIEGEAELTLTKTLVGDLRREGHTNMSSALP